MHLPKNLNVQWMKSMEIRVTAPEFGKIIAYAHPNLSPYDIVDTLDYIKSDNNDQGLVGALNAWLKKEDYQLEGTRVTDVQGDYYVLDISREFGTQMDMFGAESIYNLLRNAGLR